MLSFSTGAWSRLVLLIGTLLGLASTVMAEPQVKWIETQYIAALGDADATRGTGAELWGLWEKDPGPRGVRLTESAEFLSKGVAPAGWSLDKNDWWLEEYGRIMEQPQFPMKPGSYVVSNGEFRFSILTVHEKDTDGRMAWELSHGATLISVTHLGCRAGRYWPEKAGAACTPANAAPEQFPVKPGAVMPLVPNCSKQDYHVLLVIGVMQESS